MPRHLTTVLVGLGAFLVTAAVVLRFYGPAQLAVAEPDPREVVALRADDATVFVPATQTEVTTDVTDKQRTVGDLDAAEKASDDVVVWFTTTTRQTEDGTVVQQSMARTAMDAATAEARPCCESFAEVVDEAIADDRRTGLVLKFPFGTEQRSYQVWDSTLGKPVKADFRGTEDVDGVTAYRFVTEVPATVVGTEEVVAESIGLPGEGTVTTDRSYAVARTLYVEPRTGAILDEVRDVTETLTRDGAVVRTLFDGRLSYTDEQVRANAEKYGDRAAQLTLVEVTLPVVAVAAGLACLLGAFLLRQIGRAHV